MEANDRRLARGRGRHDAHRRYDAVVVGAGPNGLAAACLLVRTGFKTLVVEAADTVGGGVRSAELTLPGFVHDVGAALFPMALSSPFLRTLVLEARGLAWAQPPVPLAHPLDGGDAVVLERDVEATAAALGPDAGAYRARFGPLATSWLRLAEDILGPLWNAPRHPALLARYGLQALRPATAYATRSFTGPRARALFAGLAAHAVRPLEARASAAIGLALGAAGHAVGWPLPRGGAQRFSDTLADYVREHGGEIETGRRIETLDDLPRSRVVLCDLTPRVFARVAGPRLPRRYLRSLERYRYGPGVFKVDYALSEPIPWEAEACRRAGTVHVGGTLEEVAVALRQATHGRVPERPFVLLAQPSLFDDARAPAGRHTAWAYCHVPAGSDVDMTDAIERQIERFAPGFGDLVLARHRTSAAELERLNPNFVGGDIGGGVLDLTQMIARPVLRADPYATPDPRLFLCSAATPPGGGVHGMAGFHAASSALRRLRAGGRASADNL